jgi:hypothetical protein
MLRWGGGWACDPRLPPCGLQPPDRACRVRDARSEARRSSGPWPSSGQVGSLFQRSRRRTQRRLRVDRSELRTSLSMSPPIGSAASPTSWNRARCEPPRLGDTPVRGSVCPFTSHEHHTTAGQDRVANRNPAFVTPSPGGEGSRARRGRWRGGGRRRPSLLPPASSLPHVPVPPVNVVALALHDTLGAHGE